jgi:hypothetical protein
MRFVHDVKKFNQVGGSGRKYDKGSSGRAKVIICSSDTDDDENDEVLYIEGDVKHLAEVFESALEMVKAMADSWKEDAEKAGNTHEDETI